MFIVLSFSFICCCNDPGFDKIKFTMSKNTSSCCVVSILRVASDALNLLPSYSLSNLRSSFAIFISLTHSHSIYSHLMHTRSTDDFYVAIHFHLLLLLDHKRKLLIIHNSYFLLFCAQFFSFFLLFLFP